MSPEPTIASSPTSAIADLSYRGYDGPLKTRALRWWIVALATIRANINVRRFGYWVPAALILLTYLIAGVIFYFTQDLRQRFAAAGVPGDALGPSINFYAFTLNNCLGLSGVLLFAAALTVGAASIAADNRANALLVYLSKPITRADYLLGKWVGVFLLLAALSVVPALLMFLFFVIAYTGDGFLRENPALTVRLLGATLLPAVLHASLILGFSAWSKSPRTAGAVYAAFYFALAIVTGVAGAILGSRDPSGRSAATQALVSHLSVSGVIEGVGLHLYDIAPQQIAQALGNGAGRRRNRRARRSRRPPAVVPRVPPRPPLAPLLAVAGGLIVVPLALAHRRVRAVEIVRG